MNFYYYLLDKLPPFVIPDCLGKRASKMIVFLCYLNGMDRVFLMAAHSKINDGSMVIDDHFMLGADFIAVFKNTAQHQSRGLVDA